MVTKKELYKYASMETLEGRRVCPDPDESLGDGRVQPVSCQWLLNVHLLNEKIQSPIEPQPESLIQ
jgi:hypothetical protein